MKSYDLLKGETTANHNPIMLEIMKDAFEKEGDDKWDDTVNEALWALSKNYKGNVNELMAYRKYVPILMESNHRLFGLVCAWRYLAECYGEDSQFNNHKRWSKEDDELLINMACEGATDTNMSAVLRRSVSSIKTRITYLVGVKRLSSNVAGKFIGTANGEEFSANIVGKVYKK